VEQKLLFTVMSVVIATIVISKHRDNIARLRAGTENRFRVKS
jgi:glycerol-3-phosphate acyltransferase PlsY